MPAPAEIHPTYPVTWNKGLAPFGLPQDAKTTEWHKARKMLLPESTMRKLIGLEIRNTNQANVVFELVVAVKWFTNVWKDGKLFEG
jgi:hypothetical protein